MSSSQNDRDENQPNSTQLETLVLGFFKNRVRIFSVMLTDSGIILRGHCDSFHTKQMIQEIVSKHSNLRILSNELIVDET
jgi:hypothetical protein